MNGGNRMNNQIKAIIFDMDGVLINTEPLHYRIWRKIFRKRGLEISYDKYKGCIGATFEYLLDLILTNYGYNFHDDMQNIRKEFAYIKSEIIKKEGFPKLEGVEDMIRRMYQAGYRLAVASSSPQVYIEGAMKYLGIEDCFCVLNSGENVANSKPAPDTFLNTAQKLGVRPQECLVVEDSTNGCYAAKNAKMPCLAFYNPDSGEQDLSFAYKIISDWKEFTPELIMQIPYL